MAKDYSSYVVKMAEKHGVPSDIALAVYEIESNKGKNAGTSSAGARGQMQLMPGTAKDLGVDIDDPFQNIEGGVRYLGQQLKKFKDPTVAVAAYNAGPGNVRKYGGVPPFKETQDYVRKFVNIVGPQALMAEAKMPKPIKAPSVDMKPSTPYTPKQIDIAAATEENFASLLAGLGKKKRGKKAKPMGILTGLI
jgi:soluble lytic murein transglycosylase-like protein